MCLYINEIITNQFKKQPTKWLRVYKILKIVEDGRLKSPYYDLYWEKPGVYKADKVEISEENFSCIFYQKKYKINVVRNAIHVYRSLGSARFGVELSFDRYIIIPLLVSTQHIVGANETEIAASQVYLSKWQATKKRQLYNTFIIS